MLDILLRKIPLIFRQKCGQATEAIQSKDFLEAKLKHRQNGGVLIC